VVRTENLNAGRHVVRSHDRGTIRTFAFSREAPAAARHFTVATLAAWGAADFADAAALVVTELAANAVVHAHSAFTVILSALDDLLRISVRDATPLRGNTLRPSRCTGWGRWTRWPAGGE
jgi:hypothetical protein